MLSSTDIIEGAFYAVEQAGLLINDAAVLYGQRKWSSSLVLAVFSLEEIGKAEIFLQRGIDAAAHGPKTRDQVMDGQKRHGTKLRGGRGEATITASVSFWGDIPEPNGAEMAALEQQLRAAEQIAFNNAPGEAHAARMRALYVDLADGEIWARPRDTGPNDAYLMVSAASIEYGVRRTKYVHPVDAAVRQATAEIGARLPALPEAPRINWPNP